MGLHEKCRPPGSPPGPVCDNPGQRVTSSERGDPWRTCGEEEGKCEKGAVEQGVTGQGHLAEKEDRGSANSQKEQASGKVQVKNPAQEGRGTLTRKP